MRFLTFAATYGGILLAMAFVIPVPGGYVERPVAVIDLGRYPACWVVGFEEDGGTIRWTDTFELRRTPLHYPSNDRWYEAYARMWEVDGWAPAQGDSFDLRLYHDPVLRFPVSADSAVGRVYHQGWGYLIGVAMMPTDSVIGRRAECLVPN